MSGLPPAVQEAMNRLLGSSLQVTSLTGGDVNQAALVESKTARLVVKWKRNAPPGLFASEADGLWRLRQTGAIRVPAVVASDDHADPPWLALEYLPAGRPADERRFAQRFGEALAALHRENPAPDARFGLDRDNYLGTQPQDNTPQADWPVFYRDQRLLPQIARARALGLLPPERERLLHQVMERAAELLGEFTPRAVLIHGDLWSGNFLASGDTPVLIDPAVYYAEREIEIAYTELFGGFPSGFHAAYQAVFPLDPGYERRRPLHQLYPLLIHLNHFGETYGPAVEQACRRSLSALSV
jgi:fructosamine-3-kinase